jgi:hypothetical protein
MMPLASAGETFGAVSVEDDGGRGRAMTVVFAALKSVAQLKREKTHPSKSVAAKHLPVPKTEITQK